MQHSLDHLPSHTSFPSHFLGRLGGRKWELRARVWGQEQLSQPALLLMGIKLPIGAKTYSGVRECWCLHSIVNTLSEGSDGRLTGDALCKTAPVGEG